MKQITLEESKGKVLVDYIESHTDTILIFEGDQFVINGESGYMDLTDFKESDMVRLGFITPEEITAREKKATLYREHKERVEYTRLKVKFGRKGYTHEFNTEPCPADCEHLETIQDAHLCGGQCLVKIGE